MFTSHFIRAIELVQLMHTVKQLKYLLIFMKELQTIKNKKCLIKHNYTVFFIS